jgi:lysozyme
MIDEAVAIASPIVKRWEGFAKKARLDGVVVAVPYLCPAHKWTIGYGQLCSKDHPPVTEPQAEAMMRRELYLCADSALRLCPVLWFEPPARLAAVISWTYNLGAGNLQASTMRRRINQQDWAEAGRQCRRWVFAGGVKLPGLVARREQEARILEQP